MRQRDRTPEQITLWLSVIASVAYLGGGIGLIASSQSFGFLPEPGPVRYSIAAVLIIYGLFRGVRAYQRFRDELL